MRLTKLSLTLIFAATLSLAACSQGDTTAEDRTRAEADSATAPSSDNETTVTGCLTAAPDGGAFVVTADRSALASGALHAGTGEVPTYTYELTGAPNIASHVGRQVEVKGRLNEDRDDEADVDKKNKVESPETRSGDRTVTPTVETQEEIDINVRRLQVTSITPTGAPCGETSPQ